MAITTLDGIVAAALQRVPFIKTGGRTTVAAGWFSVVDVAGDPGAGTLAGVSTAAGTVPTDTTGGAPVINAFGGGATGYVTRVEFSSTVACRIALYDRLFYAGAYNFNAAAVALSAQPSFSSRLPGGDYKGLELWAEMVTAATGNQAVSVSYTNQDGTAGRTSPAQGIGAAPSVGRCWQLPLQAGDTGIQKIDSVTGTVASAGTFNVMILRPLWSGRVKMANDGDCHDFARVGMPIIYDVSNLYMLVAPDSTALGVPDVKIDIRNG